MELQLAELLTLLESVKLRVAAIESALTNIKGFYIETADGSEQGRIKYSLTPVPAEAMPVGE